MLIEAGYTDINEIKKQAGCFKWFINNFIN